MLHKLKLTNFRQHRDLTINFTGGLNVIRGPNEAGKSTIGEAVMYAFGGARALREPLADTVTWEQPENSLSVELEFSYDGVTYTLTRKKSGAELLYGHERVVGQAEVTKFIETLFRASISMQANLQMAKQGNLTGALTSGTGAVALIESLADFSVIETLIEKIQVQLPNGNTGAALQAMERANAVAAAEVPPEPDRAPVDAAEQAYKDGAEALTLAYAVRDELPIEDAKQTIRAAETALAKAQAQEVEIKRLEALVVAAPVKPAGSEAEILELEAAQARLKDNAKRVQAYNAAKDLNVTRYSPCDRTEFMANLQSATDAFNKNAATIQEAKIERAGTLALAINEDSCAFCKKSLKDVPEVLEVNARVAEKIAALDSVIKEATEAHAEAYALIEDFNAILKQSRMLEQHHSTEYWEHDTSVIPTAFKWKGELPDFSERIDYSKTIAKMRQELAAYGQALAVHESNLARLETLRGNRYDSIDDTEARAVVESYTKAEAKARELELTLRDLKAAKEHAALTYNYQVQMREQMLTAKAAALEEAARQRALIDDMTYHNELIRKIRGARPVVANKLWAIVLSSVSHYFSRSRGQPSIVTRDGDGFKVNGRGTAGLSGSTLDMLGMAIRTALLKTFLPSTPFMFLDEAAAACDDERELNLLGLIAGLDIPQVLLVTHSDAAESFAANLVQL